jgi:hypothetical protein
MIDGSKVTQQANSLIEVRTSDFFGRREHVERKAEILAMARAVQAGTQASRQDFQRRDRRAQQAKMVAQVNLRKKRVRSNISSSSSMRVRVCGQVNSCTAAINVSTSNINSTVESQAEGTTILALKQ